jgi:hypothetical protein
MKRQHGSGELYIKWGSYYGRFRTPDGRRVNRRVGSARRRGSSDGLTKSQAEAALRRLIEAESNRAAVTADERPRTVDEVIDLFRDRLALQGARLSYRQNCESMQRIHVSPALGGRRVDSARKGSPTWARRDSR